MTSPARLQLLDLPPELLLYISSHLDFSSLARLRRVSRAVHSLISSASELLYRRICFSCGITDEATAGSSTAAAARGALNWGLTARSDQFDPEELRRAIEAQRAMGDVYDDVQTWEELARRRTEVDRKWHLGDLTEDWIFLSNVANVAAGHSGVFRFKLDPETRLILGSGVDGGTLAINSSGELAWSTTLPTSSYPHIEMSNGYFSQLISQENNRFLIWRRSDILSPPSPLSSAQRDAFLALTDYPEIGHSDLFTPYCLIESPSRTNATKMRYPYHLGASMQDRKLLRYNLEELQMESIDISALFDPAALNDGAISYVELLGELCLVAGNDSVTVWSMERGFVGSFPPKGVTDGPQRRGTWAGTFSAVHHDIQPHRLGSRGNLVASTYGAVGGESNGKIVWTSQVDRVLEGGSPSDLADTTVILRINTPVMQLSVENGRCAFIIAEHRVASLWLFNLRPFTDIADFEQNMPEVHCIALPLPTLTQVSRLEMTSDRIIVPASSILSPSSESTIRAAFEEFEARLHREVNQEALNIEESRFSWETLDGRILKSWGSRTGEGDWRHKIFLPAIHAGESHVGSDSFVCYSAEI